MALLYLLLGAHVLISAGTYVIAKYGLAEIGPLTFAVLRFSLSASFVTLLTVLMGRLVFPARRDLPALVLLGFVGYPLNQLLFLIGITQAPPVHAALLYSFTPIAVLIIARLTIGEPITPPKVGGILLALSGAYLVLMEPAWRQGVDGLAEMVARTAQVFQLTSSAIQGDLIILAGVMAWSFYTVLGKPLIQRYGTLSTTAFAQLIGLAMIIPVTVVVMWALPQLRSPFIFPLPALGVERLDPAAISPLAWTSLAYLGILTSGGAYLIWYFLIRRLDTTKVAVSINLQPAATVALSYLFWQREPFTPIFFLGLALAGLGVYMTQRG